MSTKPQSPQDLDRFHLKNKNGELTGVFDFEIFKYLIASENMFVLGGVPFIFDQGCYRPDHSGAVLSTLIRRCIYPVYIKSNTIRRVHELFTRSAELQVKPEELNRFPVHWVPFSNGYWDPVEKKMYRQDPAFNAINQLAVSFNPNEEPAGPFMDEWLKFAIPNDDSREMALQFFGYTMTRDTRMQKFLVLLGEGGTGKSTLIRLLEAAIGPDNISNVSLSGLTQRFAAYGLMGKLLNSCADIDQKALDDVSSLKKLLGEDTISAEAKGKDAISFRNYARCIFSTNELPPVRDERTNGFYRRLLVLPMNQVPKFPRTDLQERLMKELPHFIWLCMEALSRMYASGRITESEESRKAVAQLRTDSDSVEAFLAEKAFRVDGERTERGMLHSAYEAFCTDEGRMPLSRKTFFTALRSKGFREYRSPYERFFLGITLDAAKARSGKGTNDSGFHGSVIPCDIHDPVSVTQDGFVVVNEPIPF